MRGRICRLQFLLALASAVILGSESLGTGDHIYCLRFEASLLVASYDSQGYGGGILPRLHTEVTTAQVKVKVTLRLKVSQSVNLGVEPHQGLMTRYLLLSWQLRSCFLWVVLSDERTGLSFVYAAGPCQRSLSWVRVPWYSRPYFTTAWQVSSLHTPLAPTA
jgi:positive regulator of sigma E activity